MATQVHNRSQRPRRHRVRRVTKAMCGHWLLVLVSHTVATIVVMIVGHLLHVLPYSGP
jgi:hypothetical protein